MVIWNRHRQTKVEPGSSIQRLFWFWSQLNWDNNTLHCNESPKMVEPMYESNIRICVLQILNHATICSKIRGGDILSGFCKAYSIISILRLSLVSCWCNFKQSCYQPEFSCSILGVFTASQAPFILRWKLALLISLPSNCRYIESIFIILLGHLNCYNSVIVCCVRCPELGWVKI